MPLDDDRPSRLHLRAHSAHLIGLGGLDNEQAFEPGLYLLPAYDSREDAIELLAQGYEEIFCSELEPWATDPSAWPSPRSLGLFQEWFAFQFFDLVSDQAQDPLAHCEVDDSFLDDLRSAIEDSPLT